MALSRVRRHPWWAAVAALLVLALVLVGARWATSGSADDDGSARGPKGAAFYEPSSEQVSAGEHGSVIWSRPLRSGTGSGSSHLVLYRSTSAKGETVPVSGVITVPEGESPSGGWPVISWGHGTTGMADACAPTRSGIDESGEYVPVREDPTADLVEQGYAVVRSHYEGLGTPGPHPYLLGQSAGAAMTDIVLAARDLEPDLSRRWLAIGHSQGAQAALFTSRFTESYSPELDLVGVVALAPPSQLGYLVEMIDRPESAAEKRGEEDRTTASSIFLGPLLVSAARVAGVPEASLLSEEGRSLVPHMEDRCLEELARPDSLGGIAPRDFLAPDADLAQVRRVVGANDAAELNPTVPLMIVQGGRDTAVPPMLTDRLTEQLEGRGADVDHVSLPRADHMTVLEQSEPRVCAWVEEAFGG